MITKEELNYVNVPANNAPYPGDDYAYDAINRLSYALAIFRRKYEGKKYSISLSNGEIINFEIKGWNLPHLLGIDYQTINSLRMKTLVHNILEISDNYKINSLVLLNRIIENADKVIANDELNNIKFLNYFKIMFKTTCFLKLSEYNSFDFGVLNFNKYIYENIIDNCFAPNATKYIFSKSGDNFVPFYMLGFKYDEDNNIMVPETIIAPYNVSDFFYQQELLLPLELSISDENKTKKIVSTNEEKIRIMNFYKSLIDDYETDVYINGLKEILPKRKILK